MAKLRRRRAEKARAFPEPPLEPLSLPEPSPALTEFMQHVYLAVADMRAVTEVQIDYADIQTSTVETDIPTNVNAAEMDRFVRFVTHVDRQMEAALYGCDRQRMCDQVTRELRRVAGQMESYFRGAELRDVRVVALPLDCEPDWFRIELSADGHTPLVHQWDARQEPAFRHLVYRDIPDIIRIVREAYDAARRERGHRQLMQRMAPPPPRATREMLHDLLEAVGLHAPQFLNEEEYLRAGSARERALALLKEWLSPQQRKQFEEHQWFEVIGGSTGQRYRIYAMRTNNVIEFDEDGHRVAVLCFGPVGDLALGDHLLAQKIALETNESEALRVANRINLGAGAVYGAVGAITLEAGQAFTIDYSAAGLVHVTTDAGC